jgi:hypothetical protein
VAPRAADGWDLPQVHVLGGCTAMASYIGVPPAHWMSPPGTHWRIPIGPNRYLTDAQVLHEVLSQVTEPATGVLCDHP